MSEDISRRQVLGGIAAVGAGAVLTGRAGTSHAGSSKPPTGTSIRRKRRDPITPRCETSDGSGTGSATSISPSLTGWTNAGAGVTGTAPAKGDIVVIVGNLNTTSATVSQTAGTGTWTFQDTGSNNGGSVSLTTFVAWRVFDGTETAPTFSWTPNIHVCWSAMALTPDTGGHVVSVDSFAAVKLDTTSSTTHTANADTVTTGYTDCSLILGGCTSTGTGTSHNVTFTAPANWSIPSGASIGTTKTTNHVLGTSIAYRQSQTGTVTPGAETMEGGNSSTGGTTANLYHLLVKETEPAAYPSVLSTSGQTIVDANAIVVSPLNGFDMNLVLGGTPPNAWSQQTFNDIYTEGGRVIRTIIPWATMETSQGTIDTTNFIPDLDLHIIRAYNAGLYVYFGFYFGPQGLHCPSWVKTYNQGLSYPDSAVAGYVQYGQTATQYLAKRYGDSSDPDGFWSANGLTFKPVVIGMGINEPTPDATTANGWMNTCVTEQCQMATWMRTYAPNWMFGFASGFGGSALIHNATGSGQTAQTFTDVTKTLADPNSNAVTNFFVDAHNSEWCTDSLTNFNWDGRELNGLTGSHNLKRGSFTSYPPTPPGGSQPLTQAQLLDEDTAWLATYVAYCDPSYANCPLFIWEQYWDPTINTSGDSLHATYKQNAYNACPPFVGCSQWIYDTNQTNDHLSARPGTGASGVTTMDGDGWLHWTDTFFGQT